PSERSDGTSGRTASRESLPRAGLLERGRRCVASAAALRLLGDLVLDGVDEGLPGGLDDVLGDADRLPLVLVVGRLDEDARDRGGAVAAVQDAHLVVDEPHLAQFGVEALERLAERAVEGVDRPVADG